MMAHDPSDPWSTTVLEAMGQVAQKSLCLFEFENYYNDFGLNFNSVLIRCWSSMWSNLFGIETLDLWNLCWSDIWKAFSLVYNVEAASAQPAPNKCCIGGSWQKFEPELAAPVLWWPVSIAYILFSLQMHSKNNMDTRSERDQGRFL